MKYALKKTRSIRIYDIATGKHKVTLNDLKTVQWTDGQETVYADGANGTHLAAFDEKKVTNLKATNGSIETGYIAMTVGNNETIVKNGTDILLREEHTVDSTSEITLKHKASGEAGSEIKFIYQTDVNGNPAKEFVQGSAATATEFKYAADTGVLTLPTGAFQKGDTVIVDYCPKFSEYTEIANDADKFSATGKVVVDAWFTDLTTEKDVPLQIVLPKGKISGTMDMSFGDQAAVQNIDIEGVTSAAAGSSKNLWKLYSYDMDKIAD